MCGPGLAHLANGQGGVALPHQSGTLHHYTQPVSTPPTYSQHSDTCVQDGHTALDLATMPPTCSRIEKMFYLSTGGKEILNREADNAMRAALGKPPSSDEKWEGGLTWSKANLFPRWLSAARPCATSSSLNAASKYCILAPTPPHNNITGACKRLGADPAIGYTLTQVKPAFEGVPPKMIETAIAGLEQVGPQKCGWWCWEGRVYTNGWVALSLLARSAYDVPRYNPCAPLFHRPVAPCPPTRARPSARRCSRRRCW